MSSFFLCYINWGFKLKGTTVSGYSRSFRATSVLLVAALGGGQAWGIEALRGGRDSRSSLEEHVGGGSFDQVRLTIGLDLGTCQSVGDALTSQDIINTLTGFDHDLGRLGPRAIHSQRQRLSVVADLPLDEGGLADLGEGIFLQSPETAWLIVLLGFFPKDTDQVALLCHAVGLLLAIGQAQEKGAELGELGHEGPDLHPTPTDADLTNLLDRDLDGSLEGEPLRVGGAGGRLYGNAGR